MTQFYNSSTQQLYGPTWPNGYTVDGQPGTPPDGSIELTLVFGDQPTPSATQKLEQFAAVDADAKTYTVTWSLSDMTRDEINASLPVLESQQMKLWLTNNSFLQTIREFINGIADDAARLEAQTRFQSQPFIRRDGAFVEIIRQRMSWTHEFVDNAFREASLL